MLTVCKLCNEQQPSNPHGGFEHPKRLYKTDAEWWKEHCEEYSEDVQEELSIENVHGFTIREVQQKMRRIREGIHALRLEPVSKMPEETQLAKSEITSGAEAPVFEAFYGTAEAVP